MRPVSAVTAASAAICSKSSARAVRRTKSPAIDLCYAALNDLQELIDGAVADGAAPGAAALVSRADAVEVASAGELEPGSIVRIASLTKPITAAAVMLLVDEALVALEDPIARWLPELESPRVVRTPQSALDDLVPAARPITVEDVLTFRAGWGFPADF